MGERDFLREIGGDWGAQHCSSLCSQSEGDDFLGGLRGLKAQQVAPLPLKGRVFKIQKKSRTIFDQINAITH